MAEGEHSAPILTPTRTKSVDLHGVAVSLYFYRGAEGQAVGPGLFLKLHQELWQDPKTPLFILLDPIPDY